MREVKTSKKERAKITAKQARLIAALPAMVNTNINGKRAMYLVKDKIKLANRVIKHNLNPTLVASRYKGISTTMIKSWVKDRNSGTLSKSNAVSVKR